MKKRLVSLVLAITITLSALLSMNLSFVFGADSSCGDNATWSYNTSTKTLTITGTGAVKDYTAVATNRVPWNSYKSTMTKVVVKEGITQLGQYNFYNCAALTTVTLPSSLRTIRGGTLPNAGAFSSCSSLRTINLPNGLKTIEGNAFRDCISLESVRIPDTVTTLGGGAFRGCSGIQTVTYGTGLTSTGEEAFYDCINLTAVNFSSTITKIDRYSFFNTRLTSIEIPEQITSIGTRAFANCTFLSEVTIYNANCTFEGISVSTDTIGQDPFNGSSQTLTFYGHKGSTTETYASTKGYNFVSIDPCEHTSTREEVVQEPTCTVPGVMNVVCEDCGFVVSESSITPDGHLWSVFETDDQSATNGHIYTYYSCDNCGEEKVSIQHKEFIEGYYDYSNSATCKLPGIETYTCLVDGCGQVSRIPSARGNHKIENPVLDVPATCTTEGTLEGVCTVCGENVIMTVPAKGHTNELVDEFDNTDDDGHTYKIYICTVCGEDTAVPTHVEWVDGFYKSRVISEPRCVVNGIQLDTCEICNTVRNVTLPATGQHEWYETARTEPTCTAVGKIYYACSNEGCNMTKSENIDALGHDYVLQEATSSPPTCTRPGYNTYKCTACAAVKKDVLLETGHTPDEEQYYVITEATCEEDGSAESVCTVCGEPFEITLKALGHDYEVQEVPIEDKPGHVLSTPVCARCGYVSATETVHKEWVEGYYEHNVTIAGTCTIPEVSQDTCLICGLKVNNTNQASGHDYHYTRMENNGTLVYTCSRCSNTETSAPQAVATAFPLYINTKPEEKRLGYMFELNYDGIINAKDYALINKAVNRAKANAN